MSGFITGLVFREYPGRGDDFMLALALADSAGEGGYVYIEATLRLLQRARLTETLFARSIARMQANGWLRVVDAQECFYRLGPKRCLCFSKPCICFLKGDE